ncbi:unnamed protein product, partial [Iphiclides podalirius]
MTLNITKRLSAVCRERALCFLRDRQGTVSRSRFYRPDDRQTCLWQGTGMMGGRSEERDWRRHAAHVVEEQVMWSPSSESRDQARRRRCKVQNARWSLKPWRGEFELGL